jgi:hypothetical protein
MDLQSIFIISLTALAANFFRSASGMPSLLSMHESQ